jgi:hypothetical protein
MCCIFLGRNVIIKFVERCINFIRIKREQTIFSQLSFVFLLSQLKRIKSLGFELWLDLSITGSNILNTLPFSFFLLSLCKCFNSEILNSRLVSLIPIHGSEFELFNLQIRNESSFIKTKTKIK